MLSIFASFTHSVNSISKNYVADTCATSLYNNAYGELSAMLTGAEAISFKRAVFITENAYEDGKLDYNSYCSEINDIATKLRKMIASRHLQKYKTAGNWAAFSYMTDTISENGFKPYTYDFNDFMGNNDYSEMFVSKLMRTHSGNCHSLPMFYKILAEELNCQACLAVGPNHLYIKHIGEDGQWVNLELTNGHPFRDVWMIETMGITTEEIKSGIYMKPLTESESVALCLFDLSEEYESKYGYDDFVLQCCNLGLKYFPNSINLLMVKAQYYQYFLKKEFSDNGGLKTTQAQELHSQYEVMYNKIDSLGYQDMPEEQYKTWVDSLHAEETRRGVPITQ